MGRSVTSKSEIGLKRKWPQKKKGVKTVVILSSPKEEGNQNYSDFGQSQIQIAIILGRVIGHFRWIQFMRILHYVLSAIPSNSRNFANFAFFRLHMNMRKQTIKERRSNLNFRLNLRMESRLGALSADLFHPRRRRPRPLVTERASFFMPRRKRRFSPQIFLINLAVSLHGSF